MSWTVPPAITLSLAGVLSRFSPQYSTIARLICLRLLRHLVWIALALARERAGRSIAARIAMIAMTTSNSISVNARTRLFTNETRVLIWAASTFQTQTVYRSAVT